MREDTIEKVNEEFAAAIAALVAGGQYDLTDSPKSFISTVQQLVAQRNERIDAILLP